MPAHEYDPQGALLTFALVLSGAAGIGLVAWLLLTVAEMAQQYAAAGAGGVTLTLGLSRKGK
jgi:hypothetical protein